MSQAHDGGVRKQGFSQFQPGYRQLGILLSTLTTLVSHQYRYLSNTESNAGRSMIFGKTVQYIFSRFFPRWTSKLTVYLYVAWLTITHDYSEFEIFNGLSFSKLWGLKGKRQSSKDSCIGLDWMDNNTATISIHISIHILSLCSVLVTIYSYRLTLNFVRSLVPGRRWSSTWGRLDWIGLDWTKETITSVYVA